MHLESNRGAGWGLALGMTSLLVIFATLPPVLSEPWRLFVMSVFHLVCHQIPERSPFVEGVQLAVCHRCYGVFWGLVAGVFGFLFTTRWDAFITRYAGIILLVSVAVPGVDWIAGAVGLWENTAFSRFVTGSVFGIAAGLYLARGLANLRQAHASPEPVNI